MTSTWVKVGAEVHLAVRYSLSRRHVMPILLNGRRCRDGRTVLWASPTGLRVVG